MVSTFLVSLDLSLRGTTIFCSYGNNNFFETFEYDVSFQDNVFYIFDRFHVLQLVVLIEYHSSFAFVCANTNSAHIYLIKRDETIRREEIQNTKTNRTEVGGWSQMRYQRHIENFHAQHAKEVVEELEKIVRTDRVDRIVLAGDQAVIIPLLREEMSKELSERVVDSLALNVDTPEHELSELAQGAVEKYELAADKEQIDHLFEVNYADGVGVTGVEQTLSALLNGQVQELYLSVDPDDIAYRPEDVK